MKKRSMLFLMAGFFISAIFSGCAKESFRDTYEHFAYKTRQVMDKETVGLDPIDSDLRRRVGIIFSDLEDGKATKKLASNFSEECLINMADMCSDVVFLTEANNSAITALIDTPKIALNQFDNKIFVPKSRAAGVGAVILISLFPMEKFKELPLLLWFQDAYHFIAVKAKVEIYDTETGTKLLDKIFFEKIVLEAEGDFSIEDHEEDLAKNFSVLHALKNIAGEIADESCKIIHAQQWKGYIDKMLHRDKVVIRSGTDVGLRKGDILNAYDVSKMTHGAYDQRFFASSGNIGEIELFKVEKDLSYGRIMKGENIRQGFCVKRKQ